MAGAPQDEVMTREMGTVLYKVEVYKGAPCSNCPCGCMGPYLTVIDTRDGAKHEYYPGFCNSADWYVNGQRAGVVTVQQNVYLVTKVDNSGQELAEFSVRKTCCSMFLRVRLSNKGIDYISDFDQCAPGADRVYRDKDNNIGMIRRTKGCPQLGCSSREVYVAADFPGYAVGTEEIIT